MGRAHECLDVLCRSANGSFPVIADITSLVKDGNVSSLKDAISWVRDGRSLYWSFYDLEGGPAADEIVEVRLNALPESIGDFVPPAGWTLHRVQWGNAFFLRRQQTIDRGAVEDMLVRMLQFADANSMRLHSWMHGAAID